MALFLLTVLLPAATLVFLGLRTASQERELARNRARDERERAARHFGQELLDELARLRDGSLAGSTARPAGLAFVLTVERDGLLLPWEQSAGMRGAGNDSPFEKLMENAERLEFTQPDPVAAVVAYQQAAAEARTTTERSRAQLGLARVLRLTGGEAEQPLVELLQLSPSIQDEFGVPMAFYAAGQLLGRDKRAEALDALRAAIESDILLSPAALHMARRYLTEGPGKEVGNPAATLRRIDQRLDLASRAQSLKASFGTVRAGLQRTSSDGRRGNWVLYGNPAWLVGPGGMASEGDGTLWAMDADALCDRVFRERDFPLLGYTSARLAPHSNQAEGTWLGEAFPDVYVRFISATGRAAVQPRHSFYWTLVVSVLGITLFGSYLWWRDMRRELRLAEMRSDFVSSVTHELKTPLTSIRMFAETMRFRQPSESQRQEYLDGILAEAERLTRLLSNVLDFARMERGTRQYDLQPAELGELIESSVRAMRQPIAEQGFEVALQLPTAPIPVRADRDAMEQAMINLLSNAMKYSGDSRRIQVEVRQRDSGGAVVVRDFGIGVHPRDHRRIFDRYYRSSEAHKTRIPGTGLGLALVKHIAEGHGGRVTVESSPGQGAKFTLWVPDGSCTCPRC